MRLNHANRRSRITRRQSPVFRHYHGTAGRVSAIRASIQSLRFVDISCATSEHEPRDDGRKTSANVSFYEQVHAARIENQYVLSGV